MVMKGLKEKVDKRSEIIGEREKGEGGKEGLTYVFVFLSHRKCPD